MLSYINPPRYMFLLWKYVFLSGNAMFPFGKCYIFLSKWLRTKALGDFYPSWTNGLFNKHMVSNETRSGYVHSCFFVFMLGSGVVSNPCTSETNSGCWLLETIRHFRRRVSNPCTSETNCGCWLLEPIRHFRSVQVNSCVPCFVLVKVIRRPLFFLCLRGTD